MKSTAAPAYTSTTNYDLAAALSVLGIEIKPDISEDRISGKRWTKMIIGLDSVPFADIGAQPDEGEDSTPLPTHKTKLIVGLVKNGKLLESDPTHPVLDVLRACKAADTLALWARSGTEHSLVKVKGLDRWQLIERPQPIGYKTQPGLLGTRDLKMAACLCVLGFQLLRLEGSSPNTLFVFGPALFLPPELPQTLRTSYRNGTLAEISPEHPLLWMMQGLSNRDAIRDMMSKRSPLVLIRAPGTGRASLVSTNAKGRTLDRVAKHLGIIV
jgi:hypothetical protein